MRTVNQGSEQLSRRARARHTRLRIMSAAHELFVASGYSGATMTQIAAAADVAVQTVYFTFHTKAELLQACYDHAVLGQDDRRPPQLQPWYVAMLAARSGSAALRHFVAGNTAIVTRVGALDDVVRSARHEPDAVAVLERSERLRRDGYHTLIEHLARRFGLAKGVDVDMATDLLLVYGGTSIYRSLVLEYGWSLQRYETWLHSTLVRQLVSSRAKP